MDLLLAGVDAAVGRSTLDGGGDAAARHHDDRHGAPRQSPSRGRGFAVGGMAKGAGMLAPGLATMLVVLTTDAVADARRPRPGAARGDCVRPSTGSTPTAACPPTTPCCCWPAAPPASQPERGAARRGRRSRSAPTWPGSCVADAEGASKEIAVEVVGAATEADAVEVGRAVARSNLLKCAIHGEDPNWGRVLAAVGTTSADVRARLTSTWPSTASGSAARARRATTGRLVDLTGREVRITVDLGAGAATATVWTNDLTADYVHENSAYST